MAAPFVWTEASETAAQLVAAGELTQDAIAARVGVVRSTLYEWRKLPEFAARVEEHLAIFRAEVRRIGLATREARVKALNDRWLKLLEVIEERAADPQLSRVPGGKTGMLVHNVKGVGKGDDFQLIDLYEVDTGTLKELREIEMQASKELGQWTERQEHSGGVAIEVKYEDADASAAETAPGAEAGTEGSEAV